jgi:PAS domain S-box-containing protein
MLIAVAADPVIVVDELGVILQANHHVYRTFGWDSSLVGQQLDVLIPERYHTVHRLHIAEFNQRPVTRVTRPMGADKDLYARRFDGSEFPVEIGLTPIGPNGHPGQWVLAYVRQVIS